MATRSMKRSNAHKTVSPTTKENNQTTETVQTPVKMNGRDIGVSNQKYAQIIDFAELQRIMMQNVGKGTSRTYIQYTRERLQQYIQNPLSNIDNIRDISAFLYRVSHNYKKIIEYYAYTPLFSYNVSYKTKDWSKPPKAKDFMKNYQALCQRLDNMNLKQICTQMIATCLRDGIFVGFCYDNEDSFFLSQLDPKYCKISALSDKNTYVVKFDASFFDVGNNKDYIYGIEDSEDESGLWADEFLQGYEDYKAKGNAYKWFELPVEKTITVICGDDPIAPLPYFIGIFSLLMTLIDYEDLIRNKAELENYVLLISKIPLISNTEDVNDFAVDLDLVRATQAAIDEVAPALCGTAFTPCEIEKIDFSRSNVDDTNIYSDAITNLMDSIGVSEAIFNGKNSNSVGLKHSIAVDMTLPFEILKRIEANIQRYIKLNITEEFDFKFHQVSVFNKEEYLNQLKDEASLGLPCKLDYATAGGKSPLDVMNTTLMENALGLIDIWQPLSSSYNTSDKQGGGQSKSDDQLSDSGLKTRDDAKNETTKAGK